MHSDTVDNDGLYQNLSIHVTRLNGPNHIHALGNSPKGREALPIRITHATEIEGVLITDDEEEGMRG